VHMIDATGEHEKLVNLDGPAREVIRNNEQVRCYYPDAKIIRIEPRTYRNAFPSLLPQQLDTLTAYYFFRKAEIARIAGLETQAYIFEPKDGMRYGHKLWADLTSGLLLKAQLMNDRNVPIEQFVFTDIQIGLKIERDTVRPSFRPPPVDWEMRESLPRSSRATARCAARWRRSRIWSSRTASLPCRSSSSRCRRRRS